MDFRLFFARLAVCLALLLRPFAVGGAEPAPLTLGIIPFNSTAALLRTHQPLRDYLEKRLGRPVMIYTAPDYVRFHEESLAGHYDLLITGPHFAVFCLEHGYLPVVRYRLMLRPVFVVRKDSPIHGIDDLRGKRIGLSSRLSISSIGGVKWLQDHGLVLDRDYRLFERATHGAAVASVAVGELDAALTTYTPLNQIPPDVRAGVRILPIDMQVPHLMTLVHPRLGASEIARIRAAFAEFPETPEGRRFFSDTGYEGYAPITEADLRALQPYLDLTRKLLPPRPEE
jgi:phosphonate transport system substrate-binding protein